MHVWSKQTVRLFNAWVKLFLLNLSFINLVTTYL